MCNKHEQLNNIDVAQMQLCSFAQP